MAFASRAIFNIRNYSGALASVPRDSRIMPQRYPALRRFLYSHHGYFCESCLAARLHLPADEVDRSLRHRTFAEVAVAYKICQSCLDEKAVFALRQLTSDPTVPPLL